jgi:Condensation domain
VAFVRKLTRRGSAGERAGDRGLQMTSTTESGDASTTAPLTFGQMSVWRDIAGLPQERWQEANIFHRFDFPKPVSRRQLCQVLTELDAKHESLRTVYDIDDPAEPRQRLLPPQPVTEVEVVYSETGDVEARIERMHRRSFDLRTDRPVRALAIASGQPTDDVDQPNLTGMVFCWHHIACDGWSVGLLVMDVLALLGFGGEPQPVPATSLREVAVEQRTSSFWRTKLKSTQRHFRMVYEAETASFRDRDPERGGVQAALESAPLYTATQALVAEHNVSVSTVFTAAFADALRPHCGPGPIRMGLMTGNRFTERWRPYVTSMNQLIPILIDGDPDADFVDGLSGVGVTAMRAYRLGMFDVDQVTPAALGLDLQPSDVKALCMLNVMNFAPPEFDAEPSDGELPELHWEPVFSNISAGCYLRVFHTTASTVRLRLRTGGLTEDTVRGILLGIHQRVLAAA